MEIEKNKEYSYSQIEEHAIDNKFLMSGEHSFDIGSTMINLHSREELITFLLTGTRGEEGVYECVFKNKK